jgi:predicted metal-binding membrane protein
MSDWLTHLSPAEIRLGHAVARPKLILGIVALAGFGWIYMGLTAAHISHWFMPSGHEWSASDFAAAGLMWGAMALAMMLPSAAPMILTYAEIAETAARKGERIVSPWVLAAGYIAVWFGFAGAAALLQGALTYTALIDATSAKTDSILLSAALFLAAGLYQFAPLKHACLSQCQRPFPFFFANWTTRPRGVLLLGLRQGLYCLGCCWALMLLMFAVGVMNVVWMIVLGVLIIGEKMTTRIDRPLGVLLLVIGTAFALAAGQL